MKKMKYFINKLFYWVGIAIAFQAVVFGFFGIISLGISNLEKEWELVDQPTATNFILAGIFGVLCWLFLFIYNYSERKGM